MHNHLRTHGSEGATEPGWDGSGPVGPGRLAWPTPDVGSPRAPWAVDPKDIEA
jgi:hypothetical protein